MILDTISFAQRTGLEFLYAHKGEMQMKGTGIIRRIDELNRVEIPKEIRRTLGISDDEPFEIIPKGPDEIILKKYRPTKPWYIDSITEEVKYSEDWKPSNIGNAFATQEEAVWMLEHLKLIHEMKEWIRENDDDFKSYRTDDDQDKYFLYQVSGKTYYDLYQVNSLGLNICFSCVEKAKEAVEHFGEERILKYYFPN